MERPAGAKLQNLVFIHNACFLFFFFITPKFYLSGDFGLRGEDILFPFTTVLFFTALPEIKKLKFPALHKAVAAYFGYVLILGLTMSPITGALKYFPVIFTKQLQYFMVFYLMLYSFKTYEIKARIIKFTGILVGTNLLWAFLQIMTGHRVEYLRQLGEMKHAYGIGAIAETQPHQAAAIFLFCFIFSYFHRSRFRIPLMIVSAAAVFMTVSRITIAAFAVCLLYIILTDRKAMDVIKKPAAAGILAVTLIVTALAADRLADSGPGRHYGTIRARFSGESLSRGIRKRKAHLDKHLLTAEYIAHAPLNFATGMGRGYANTAVDSWRMAGDSGYLRDFVEIGAIGLVLHILIFVKAAKYAGMKKYLVILLPYLVLNVTYEVFLMSKSGFIILILTAVLLYDGSKKIRGKSVCPENSG